MMLFELYRLLLLFYQVNLIDCNIIITCIGCLPEWIIKIPVSLLFL